MITPPFLRPGDKVGILATARRIKYEEIDRAVEIFRQWKLEIILSPYLFSADHSYLAGTDDQRATALQQFVDDPAMTAIFCARGGYGTTRIIDQIDFTKYLKSPKWIIGFSDVTALHLKISALGSKSIHGIMPALFSKNDSASSIESLRMALFESPPALTATKNDQNKIGTAKGTLVGGNLSILVDSLATPYELNTDGKILVVEEVDEYLYKIDRMFVQLRRAKKLEKLAGLVVGHFSEIKDTELPFGESFEEIIRCHTKDLNFPIGFNFPIGHLNPNYAWVSGGDAQLEVQEKGSSLKFSSQ